MNHTGRKPAADAAGFYEIKYFQMKKTCNTIRIVL